MTEDEPTVGEIIYGMVLAHKKPEEARGFNDAMRWFMAGENAKVERDLLMEDFHEPPEGLDGCEGCKSDRVASNDCPRCQYELGFTDGASK